MITIANLNSSSVFNNTVSSGTLPDADNAAVREANIRRVARLHEVLAPVLTDARDLSSQADALSARLAAATKLGVSKETTTELANSVDAHVLQAKQVQQQVDGALQALSNEFPDVDFSSLQQNSQDGLDAFAAHLSNNDVAGATRIMQSFAPTFGNGAPLGAGDDPQPTPYHPTASDSPFAPFGNSSDQITQMFNTPNQSFFALAIATMLYGYRKTSDAGSLLLIKQKDAQAAASCSTEMQKLFIELKDDISSADPTILDLSTIFDGVFNNKAGFEKYKGLLNFKDDLNCVLDKNGKPVIDGGFSKDNTLKLLNGLIKIANTKLNNNEVSASCQIDQFTDLDITPGDSKDATKVNKRDEMTKFFDLDSKSCDGASSQLTTLNQTIQASVNLETQSINGLLETLKSLTTSYGTAINQRG